MPSLHHADKERLLRKLARKRQRSKWPGYKGIGDYPNSNYECPYVSPYTKSAGNVDADIMVLLQDWSSDNALKAGLPEEDIKLGYSPSLPTNKRLISLLDTQFGVSLMDVYATNLFPFIKPEHLGTTIPRLDYIRAAREFALPQITIVRPKLVICLGQATFNALREECGYEPFKLMKDAIASPFDLAETRVWCQAHTGRRGQNNRGRMRVLNDWKRMKEDVSKRK
jgi:hypothetical protein